MAVFTLAIKIMFYAFFTFFCLLQAIWPLEDKPTHWDFKLVWFLIWLGISCYVVPYVFVYPITPGV